MHLPKQNAKLKFNFWITNKKQSGKKKCTAAETFATEIFDALFQPTNHLPVTNDSQKMNI